MRGAKAWEGGRPLSGASFGAKREQYTFCSGKGGAIHFLHRARASDAFLAMETAMRCGFCYELSGSVHFLQCAHTLGAFFAARTCI
jgi:hypothetical protein